jgi:hypothetical protein
MNLQEAMKKLVPPLIFGNPEQIECVDYIATFDGQLARCLEAMRRCPNALPLKCSTCRGRGSCSHCYATCLDCDGTGIDPDGCACLEDFDAEVIAAAQVRLGAREKMPDIIAGLLGEPFIRRGLL